MRVEVAVLWRGGKQIPRWQFGVLEPVCGQLVIEEVRDDLLHRSMRVATLINVSSPGAPTLTLYDVTVLYAKDYTLSLSGFLQDPHEDGHLFTIAKPTKSGLVILDSHQFIDADLAPNEAMVMAGSLLASLTEDFIKPAIHAVDGISAGKNRLSVLYFVNPDPARELRTWTNERPVDIGTQMRVRHTEFGNAPLTIKSSRRPEPR